MTSRTLIANLDFALTADDQDRALRDAALVVEGDRVSAIGPTEEILANQHLDSEDRRIDGRRMGVIPGLIDSHVHLSETLSRAVFPDNLATRAWVFHWAKPFYANLNQGDERISVLLGATEMLRCGTTCFLDMGAQVVPQRSISVAAPPASSTWGRSATPELPVAPLPRWACAASRAVTPRT